MDNHSFTTVLLIEDNPGDAALFRQMLLEKTPISFRLTWVDTLAKAFANLNDQHVDVILLDLNLPDSTGIETVQQLCLSFPLIPIIVLTGFDDDATAAQSIRDGAEDYLVKNTINKQILTRSIRYAIERKQSKIDLHKTQEQQQSILAAMPDFLFRIDLNGVCLDVHGPSLPILATLQTWIGKNLAEVLPPELADVIRQSINRAHETERLVADEFDYTIVNKTRHLEGRFVACGSKEVLVIVRDVTRNKKTQLALAESEERYRQLVESSPDGIGVYTAGREIVYINPAGAKLLGANHSTELLGRDISEFLHSDYKADSQNRHTEFLNNTNHAITSELKMVGLEGQVIDVETFGTSIYFNGKPAIQSMMRDVTERKRKERLLRESEEKFRQLAEYLPYQVFWIMDTDGRMIYVSPDYESIFGLPVEDAFPDPLFFDDIVHPDDRYLTKSASDVRNQIRFGINRKYRIIRPDGITRWIWTNATPIKDEQGNVYRIVGTSTDVTEQAQSENQLRALAHGFANQMHLLYSILNTIGDGVVVIDTAGKVIVFNPTAEEILGMRPVNAPIEEWAKHYGFYYDNTLMMVGGSEMPLVAAVRGYRIDQKEYYIKNKYKPHGVFISATARPLLDEAGELSGSVMVFRDITGRKQVEDALRTNEKRLRSVVENMPVLMIAFDNLGRLIVWNRECERVTGYSSLDVIGNPKLAELLMPGYQDSQKMLDKWRRQGEESDYRDWEFELTCKDGTVKTISWSNISGEFPIPGWASWGIGIDVTARRRAEEALKAERESLAARVKERTQELEMVNAQLSRASRLKDEFLANMSHELRTPLNAVLGSTEILIDGTFGAITDQQKIYLGLIQDSGYHLLDLINDILDLSKIEAGKLELSLMPVDVQFICETSLQFVRQEIQKKQQHLKTQFDLSVTSVEADERRLKQILVNLLSNAVKFTPPDGQVGLEVVGREPEGYVDIVVWDTGIGIADEDLQHLFNPFEQLDGKLSRQQEGTGLGLALVLRLVKLHKGQISVESKVGQGSRFVVSLPWYK
ncbi:MAG: PAS domain S-box protein [Anaerolineae bacterium]|nr:PAS domain S-box protein [Anaerolineae bacterium]